VKPASRRSFLARGVVVAVGSAGLGAACADDAPQAASSARQGDGSDGDEPVDPVEAVIVPFRQARQVGVVAPPAAAGIVAGLRVHAEDRDELIDLFRTVSREIELVMSGEPYERRAGGYPPLDTGVLGVTPGPTNTTILLGVGASLFDGRYGLARQRPAELVEMPKFANDYLVKPERSHGDLSLTVQAGTSDAAMHALRQVLRRTRGQLSVKWMREGYNSLHPHGKGEAPARNLMGFKDGTSNLDVTDAAVMDRWVFVQAGDEPAWAVGGTYQAVRVIRMLVEFWDRTRLSEQEALMGRHRDSGAPLGMSKETDVPVFTEHQLRSHIARANPRAASGPANLMLRRPFTYASGVDENEQLDQGLLFTCYQRSLTDSFITVQTRLDGEALDEYLRPLGGGFFLVLPGPGDDPESYLGATLLEG